MKIRPIFMRAREKFGRHAFHLCCIPAGDRKLCRPNFSRKMVERFLSVCIYCVHAEVTASCDAVTGYSTLSIPIVVQAALYLHKDGIDKAER